MQTKAREWPLDGFIINRSRVILTQEQWKARKVATGHRRRQIHRRLSTRQSAITREAFPALTHCRAASFDVTHSLHRSHHSAGQMIPRCTELYPFVLSLLQLPFLVALSRSPFSFPQFAIPHTPYPIPRISLPLVPSVSQLARHTSINLSVAGTFL